MTLDVAREEVVSPGRLEMVNDRFQDKSHEKCYKCDEFGHYNNECPKLKNQEANLIEREPTL